MSRSRPSVSVLRKSGAVELFLHDLVDVHQRHLDDLHNRTEAFGLFAKPLHIFWRECIEVFAMRTANHVVIGRVLIFKADSDVQHLVLRAPGPELAAERRIRLDQNTPAPAFVKQISVVEYNGIRRANIQIGRIPDRERFANRVNDQIFPLLRVGGSRPGMRDVNTSKSPSRPGRDPSERAKEKAAADSARDDRKESSTIHLAQGNLGMFLGPRERGRIRVNSSIERRSSQ